MSRYLDFCNRHLRVTNEVLQEGGHGISDTRRLHILDKAVRHHGMPCREARLERSNFHSAIREKTEDGKIAIVFSGRDCDNVRYAGDVHIVSSDWRKIDVYLDHYDEWADGPWGYHFEKPSTAKGIHYRSRDLGLEAFENGHSHLIIDPGHI